MSRRDTIKILDGVDAPQDNVVEAPRAVDQAGGHMAIQLACETGETATIELYGRLTSAAPWTKFMTVSLTDAGFMRAYFGVPNLGVRLTSVSGGAVDGWAFWDE